MSTDPLRGTRSTLIDGPDVTITVPVVVAQWLQFWTERLPDRWAGQHPRDLFEDQRRLKIALAAFEAALTEQR